MGVEYETQSYEEHQHIKTRELQQENMNKLEEINNFVNDINFDNIENDTQTIKSIVINNLENQTNIDDLSNTLDKIAQGVIDIKRSQTNINKKINEIEQKIGE